MAPIRGLVVDHRQVERLGVEKKSTQIDVRKPPPNVEMRAQYHASRLSRATPRLTAAPKNIQCSQALTSE
jgi:hypothetical protein